MATIETVSGTAKISNSTIENAAILAQRKYGIEKDHFFSELPSIVQEGIIDTNKINYNNKTQTDMVMAIGETAINQTLSELHVIAKLAARADGNLSEATNPLNRYSAVHLLKAMDDISAYMAKLSEPFVALEN